ncbi:hypothetical protein WDU94_006536 [Cyamophila willieti]
MGVKFLDGKRPVYVFKVYSDSSLVINQIHIVFKLIISFSPQNRENVAVQVINIEEPDPRSLEKPPDYSSVVDFPPSYEDAIKELDANKLLYACVTNNNYEDPIKSIEDTFVIISHIDENTREALDQVDNRSSANIVEISKPLIVQDKQDFCQQKESKDTMKSTNETSVDKDKELANIHSKQSAGHSIVEIPETAVEKNSSNTINEKSHTSNNRTKELKDSLTSENAGILVSSETRTSNTLSSVLRKSFRSLRKSATLPSSSSEQNNSNNCDIEIHASRLDR